MKRRLRVRAVVCVGMDIKSTGDPSVIEIDGDQVMVSQQVAEALFLPPFMQPDAVSRPHLVATLVDLKAEFVPRHECRFPIWGDGGKVVMLIAHEVQEVAIPETSAA